MTKSLNKVQLIGNLTRDPELRYTPQGTAVCTLGLATNRSWTTGQGEKKEDVEFHRIVAWQKLAELCAEYLNKGSRIFVEGRLQTRKWKGQDEVERTTTEIVITDMIMLGGRGGSGSSASFDDIPADLDADLNASMPSTPTSKKPSPKSKKQSPKKKPANNDADGDDDIPF